MSHKHQNAALPATNPIVIGTGLIALDLVVTEKGDKSTRYFAGGTCGNVLTVLSYLGWKSYPFARLNGDFTSRWVRDDMKRFGVQTDFLSLEPKTPVPVIIEWIGQDKEGNPRHKYSFVCPTCGSRKPGHKPVLATVAKGLLPKAPSPQVFFFDRVSKSTIILASEFRQQGAIVVFEPSGVGEPRLFREALSLAHILKYSADRMAQSIEKYDRATLTLEIETQGSKGIRFRSRLPGVRSRAWKIREAFPVKSLKDAAGSGDWMTGALLNKLGRTGASGLMQIDEAQLEAAIRFAQAAAAWNCNFEAPRGGMYSASIDKFVEQVVAIEQGEFPEGVISPREPRRAHGTSPNGACLRCHAV